MSKFLIIDDHMLFSGGLKKILISISSHYTIDSSANLFDANILLTHNHYDIIFLDIVLPDTTHEEVKNFVSYCNSNFPLTKIIVISSISKVSLIRYFFTNSRIKGWLSKNANLAEFTNALSKVQQGVTYIGKDINSLLAQNFLFSESTELTKKELEILLQIANGFSVKQIAENLFLSQFTVLAHRRNIMKKLNLHSAQELVKYAFENRLV